MTDEESWIAALAHNVQSARCDSHLSQRELAALTGLSRQGISNIERGRGNVTVQSVWRIARALQVPPIDLLGGWEL